MSLKFEQYRALKITRDFLREIISSKEPLRKKELRKKAYRCLRHYPHLNENGKPLFSNDEFTED